MTINKTTSLPTISQTKREIMQPPQLKKRKLESCDIGSRIFETSYCEENEQTNVVDALNQTKITNPVELIKEILRIKGYQTDVKNSISSPLFHQPTEEEMTAYTQDVLKAVRSENIDELRAMHKAGKYLQCCNRFGESIIHMACRRGLIKVLRFLIDEAQSTVYVRDDYGRTAMHDAAWSSQPNIELMDYLIEKAPQLLLLSDVRGHTPFSYVRKEHWPFWIQFLKERQQKIAGTPASDESIIVLG